METVELVERLSAEAKAVKPLPPPQRRAALLLATILLGGAALVALWGDVQGMHARYGEDKLLMMVENGAMLATAVLAVLGAFIISVPGHSWRWLLAPLPALLVWVAASGLGCYQELARPDRAAEIAGHGGSCLAFIVGAGIPIGALLLWRLSRARPIDPLPVALLGGLGSAALSACLLQFFHPFGLTLIDLGLHAAAVLIVVGLSALSHRRALAPA